METLQGETQMTESPKVEAKRKYVRLSNADFIALANGCANVREIAEKTGMSLAGIRFKIIRLLPGKKIKKSLMVQRKPK